MYDLIIIGAGPAGLTAALYSGRARLRTLVLEKLAVGGRILLTEIIENYPGFSKGVSSEELIRQMHEQVQGLGVHIEPEEAIQIDCKDKTVKTNARTYSGKAIIIASGARPRKLGIPGEEELTGKGVSYCATCDGPLYRDKDVAVIGGGNAVAEEALFLARFARTVNIVHRRQDLRASEILQEKLRQNNKINFIFSAVATGINGSQKVESLQIKDLNTQKERLINCAGVFVYIGYEPETEIVKNKLQLDESGFIITGEQMGTSEEGIFACGDCRRKSLYQVVTACADGATAADSAYKYITAKA
jgi:thioredoxin reductase (NADPH)